MGRWCGATVLLAIGSSPDQRNDDVAAMDSPREQLPSNTVSARKSNVEGCSLPPAERKVVGSFDKFAIMLLLV